MSIWKDTVLAGRKVAEVRPHGAPEGAGRGRRSRRNAIGGSSRSATIEPTRTCSQPHWPPAGLAISVSNHDSRARLPVTGTADVRRLLEIIVRCCARDVAQPAPSA